MNKKSLLTLIENSFYEPASFSEEEICVRNHTFEDYEGNKIAEFFSGKSNSDITFEGLSSVYDGDYKACLSFMQPEAAAYFIGAYMHIALQNNNQDLALSTFNFLSAENYTHADDKSRHAKIIQCMSNGQKVAIVEYLLFLQSEFSDALFFADFVSAISKYEN